MRALTQKRAAVREVDNLGPTSSTAKPSQFTAL